MTEPTIMSFDIEAYSDDGLSQSQATPARNPAFVEILFRLSKVAISEGKLCVT
jgi:hypothetical protein